MVLAVTGLNHITLAVSDVPRSLAFYRDVLGFRPRAIWDVGAYLEIGTLWLCLSKDKDVRLAPHPDYTHIAFGVSDTDYPYLRERIMAHAAIWKDNQSEGSSTYFLDPDGHKIEIHVGSLETRLDHYRSHPDKGVEFFD
ncbi:Glutathione transferase FosA [Acetobacter malorum]|uniref:Glutathione transferase FosA n=1 Tax=Acetobacter malorum TaxID=178901 RepID=A0A177G4L9_9PROT|nr:VOC family protein [Acetobacter malorum]OAG75273.1 Glutathione transferase FosA [Acetobacter malorum]